VTFFAAGFADFALGAGLAVLRTGFFVAILMTFFVYTDFQHVIIDFDIHTVF
jgi:hypothetical protein